MEGNPYVMSLITQTGVIITAVLGFITVLIQTRTNKKAKQSEKSMMILLRSQIVSKCENYQELGYLPDYARSCLCDLFEQYTALGGNHGVNLLVDEVLKLPSIKINKK